MIFKAFTMCIQHPIYFKTANQFVYFSHFTNRLKHTNIDDWQRRLRQYRNVIAARPIALPLYKLLLLDNGFVLLSNNFTSTEIVIRKKSENPFNDEGTCNKDNGDTCSTQKPAPTFKEGPDFGNELVPLSLRDWWFVFFSSFL